MKKLINKLGVDKAIAYSSAARIVQAGSNIVTIFFLAKYLSQEEQGFYYTFGSLVAVQVFFELGLTNIITQFVAHEYAYVTVENDKSIYKSRLSSLLHFCIKWYFYLSILLFFILIIVGWVFFTHYDTEGDNVSWKIPWFLISFGTCLRLFQSPLNSFLLGMNKVEEMSLISLYQQLILPISMWLGLYGGLKLYVVGISLVLSAVVWYLYVYFSKMKQVLIDIYKNPIIERIKYVDEIFPFQWRIAISWISGYLIYQLFTPVIFATGGAIIAGQIGMTLQVLNGIQALSMSWINTKIPLLSNCVALKKYSELDLIFSRTLKQMLAVIIILFFVFIGGLFVADKICISINGELLTTRFLSCKNTFYLFLSILLNVFVVSWASYLRCHKKEPFLLYSILCGLVCCMVIFFTSNIWGVEGVILGYLFINILFLPYAYLIFVTKKKQWHG